MGRALFGRLGIPRTATFCVALSGGLDSTVLLHALATLRREPGNRFTLGAFHVDHGLHADSRCWAEACRQLAAGLGVPCEVETVRVAVTGGGPEEAARVARYAALARRLAPGEILLTAHHRDDQAETVLLQMFRGAGLHGLAAMPGKAPFAGGWIVRPLLDFPRSALAAYARAMGLSWVDDPSNGRIQLRRNRIRHRLMPAIQDTWPQASAALARTARTAALAANLADDTARVDLASCRLSGPLPGLSVPALRSLPPGRLENALRLWLRQGGYRAPSQRHLDGLARRIRIAPHTGHESLPGPGYPLRRYRDGLYLGGGNPPPPLDQPWDPGEPVELPELGLRVSTEPAFGQGLSSARIAGRRIRLRLRQGGERCRLPGHRQHHDLKKLLQRQGVAPWLRPRLPLVFVDDELAAVADLFACEPFAATPHEPGLRLILQQI